MSIRTLRILKSENEQELKVDVAFFLRELWCFSEAAKAKKSKVRLMKGDADHQVR